PVYAQNGLVHGQVGRRLDAGGRNQFDVQGGSLDGIDGDAPRIRFRHKGEPCEIACDYIGGCDGSHGVCRPSIPAGVLRTYEKVYPFAWLGILVEAASASSELIYAHHERGFALMSMRG